MSLYIYHNAAYNNHNEMKMFVQLQHQLEKTYGTASAAPCLLVYKYQVNDFQVDVLLAGIHGITLLQFIDEAGNIEKAPQGRWTANGKIVYTPQPYLNPLDRLTAQATAAANRLQSLLGTPHLHYALLFLKPVRLSASIQADADARHIQLTDSARLHHYLHSQLHTDAVCRPASIQALPQRLALRSTADSPSTVNAYEPEASTNFFKELETALTHQPDYPQVYAGYNKVFQKCLDQHTSFVRVTLGGTFAKTDYLLKACEAPAPLIAATNDTRVRLRTRHELPADQLQQHCLHDLKTLCRFIALIYRCDIPATLTAKFPTSALPHSGKSLKLDSIRLIVDHWDDHYLYGHADLPVLDHPLQVSYTQGNRSYPYDWSYLKDLLYKGAQLNLVRPYSRQGIIYPELLIFEPDYLIDITTIARCFTNYAESAIVHLLYKIEPAQNTEAIVLGNLAGQLLDETIHQLPNSHPYAQSVTDFFKHNAFSLLTADISPAFHEEAQKQKRNIAEALYSGLPRLLQHFDSREGMVEPSFFSEMLGMQGRMDYLQSDFKVLLEQKSGKGEFPYDHFVKPRQKEDHYVQMLLYMTLIRYNYHDIYQRNGKELHAFLLYSKYHDSLLGLGFAPELIFRAVKVRNELAWYEQRYTTPGGFSLLGSLTPDELNEKHVNNKLWTQYQVPHIEALLAPIHEASPLERAYYYRFLTFIANEHMLSKLGNKTKENSGFASKWHDSLDDKLLAGNIYDKLTLLTPIPTESGSVRTVSFRFSENEDNDMSNFRVGDIVIFYPYDSGKEPDARKTMVFRSTIARITADTLSLSLRAAQSDDRIFLKDAHRLWAVEHDFIESSYNALYRGMHAFLTAPVDRRNLLLLQRTPRIDPHRRLKGDYGPFNELSLRVKQALDLFLIIGPPGTGKTSFGLLNTLKEELLEPDGSVLLMSYTNRAVDEICSKLHESAIPFIRIGGELTCAPDYRDSLLSENVLRCPNLEALRRQLTATRVFVGTTTALQSNLALFRLKSFSLAIIDEASQILEPHLLGLLSARHGEAPAIRKMVFIGDHKQLPAVVQQPPEVSRVTDPQLQPSGLTDCRLSLFERLLRRYRNNPQVTYMLRHQGRMHPDIAAFPNYAFYNNRLTAVPCPHQQATLPLHGQGRNGIVDLLLTRRIAFLAVGSPAQSPSDKVNQAEADIIAATVVTLYGLEREHFSVSETVGVIVPYRNQIATVRNTIDRYGIAKLHDITIDTVERYQGSQRKYILYGFTVQQYYQLNFLTNNVFVDVDGSVIDRKLNVAMTRAEEHLILVGNPELLANNFTFFKLMEYVKSRHGFFRVQPDTYVRGEFTIPPYSAEALLPNEADFGHAEKFEKAFEHLVLRPLQNDKQDDSVNENTSEEEITKEKFVEKKMQEEENTEKGQAPNAAEALTQLEAIGYGRSPLTAPHSTDGTPSADLHRQILLNCRYYLRRHYYCSRHVFTTCAATFRSQLQAVSGRVQFIDLQGGAAASGLAFVDHFVSAAPQLVYTLIDESPDLRKLGTRFMAQVAGNALRHQTATSLSDLTPDFWQGVSELPSLVVFNLPFVFARLTAHRAEQLGRQIVSLMQTHPLNTYLILIQQGEDEQTLNACKVFCQLLEPHTRRALSGHHAFSYPHCPSAATWQFHYLAYTNH